MSAPGVITGATYTSPTGASYAIPHERIQIIEGLSNAKYRHSTTKLAGVRGSQYNQSLQDVRAVNIEWEIMKDTLANYIIERDDIFEAFNPDDGEGTLTIVRNNTESFTLTCIPNATPRVPERAAAFPQARAQVQLIANDPTILSLTEHSSGAITAPSGGGFTFPATFDIIFEQTASGSVTVQNAGNIDTYPVITLTDDLTNPIVRNATTGEFFQLNYVSSVGDVIVIDMKAGSVILNGDTNLIQDIVTGSEFWPLVPGSNQIIISTGATTNTGTMSFTWNDAWNSI